MPERNHIEKDYIFCGGHISTPGKKLKAGSLSMIYEGGNIRYISAGSNEIIRMIYSAVRDKEWLTIIPEISDEKIKIKSDSFRIEYKCNYRSGDTNFLAYYQIEGRADNSLIFSFEGEALTTFEKCRIGYCILHPVEVYSGRPCNIMHSDGNKERLSFPVYISPEQPFLDIRSMKWSVNESEYSLVFSGDVFETEDQRNWSDDSYKTYCTPLNLPCPATIRKGERISQRIELKAELGPIGETGNTNEVKIVINPEQTFAFPLIGIGRSTRPAPLTEKETDILRSIKFDHYRTDLYLFNSKWRNEAETATLEAEILEIPLELALFFDNNYKSQSEDFVSWVKARQPGIKVISLFHKTESSTPDMLIEGVAPILKNSFPDLMIGCGTNANFAELNRAFPVSDLSDFVCYSIHPQEHASDNLTMVENLRSQTDSVESARYYSGGKQIRVSPVNIQRRFNANIENYETPSSANSFPPQIDSRLISLFGACWTTGSLKYLCEAGVKSATYFETAGERGIIQGDYSTRWPVEFKSSRGMIFPVFHLFKWLLANKSFRIVKSRSSVPLKADILALTDGKNFKVAVCNFTPETQTIMINGIKGDICVISLENQTFDKAASDPAWIENEITSEIKAEKPLIMSPFSVSFIEGKTIH